ncbi:hypothetical protein [Sulfurovum sp.]|uniref:hypothetical protein n=1 Tax=Sulfurovum sp. TaxID=1969726 RepID=UPI00286816A1|nr:hypothetical protein [Sulfurovum sp.]
MKILFVENRYKTYFWEQIAKELSKHGHEIFWLIQNHTFAPAFANVYKVPYPATKLQLENEEDSQSIFDFIQTTDRIINYFNGANHHYSYYYKEFMKIITDVKPNLVIGESTLFHELMIIDICKKNNILYLHPSSTSYPIGRFSFFAYDTKEPFNGSNEILSDEECDLLIQNISDRKIVPDYMKKVERTNSSYPTAGSIRDKWTIMSSFFKGEIYNTPSPLRKLAQDLKVKNTLRKWDKLAESSNQKLPTKNIILYPLQMQPEANLDVWGNQFRNQTQLAKELAAALPEDWHLVIKTNPKSKYEMNEALLQVVKNTNNIIPLHSNTPMKDIFDLSTLVVTVTGTVAIECILVSKPLGLLGPSVVKGFNGCNILQNPKEINNVISLTKNNQFTPANINDKRNLIKKLVASSYKGLITDPVSNPNCLQQDNLDLIVQAILDAGLKEYIYEN